MPADATAALMVGAVGVAQSDFAPRARPAAAATAGAGEEDVAAAASAPHGGDVHGHADPAAVATVAGGSAPASEGADERWPPHGTGLLAAAAAVAPWDGAPAVCRATTLFARAALAGWAPCRHSLYHDGVRSAVRVVLLVAERLRRRAVAQAAPGAHPWASAHPRASAHHGPYYFEKIHAPCARAARAKVSSMSQL